MDRTYFPCFTLRSHVLHTRPRFLRNASGPILAAVAWATCTAGFRSSPIVAAAARMLSGSSSSIKRRRCPSSSSSSSDHDGDGEGGGDDGGGTDPVVGSVQRMAPGPAHQLLWAAAVSRCYRCGIAPLIHTSAFTPVTPPQTLSCSAPASPAAAPSFTPWPPLSCSRPLFDALASKLALHVGSRRPDRGASDGRRAEGGATFLQGRAGASRLVECLWALAVMRWVCSCERAGRWRWD